MCSFLRPRPPLDFGVLQPDLMHSTSWRLLLSWSILLWRFDSFNCEAWALRVWFFHSVHSPNTVMTAATILVSLTTLHDKQPSLAIHQFSSLSVSVWADQQPQIDICPLCSIKAQSPRLAHAGQQVIHWAKDLPQWKNVYALRYSSSHTRYMTIIWRKYISTNSKQIYLPEPLYQLAPLFEFSNPNPWDAKYQIWWQA